MSAGRYKQFLRVIEKWPLDPTKSRRRDLGALIRDRFSKEFKDGHMTEIKDPEKCDKILASIDNMASDKYKEKYFVDIKMGALATDSEFARAAVSDEALKELKGKRSPFLSAIGYMDDPKGESKTEKEGSQEK